MYQHIPKDEYYTVNVDNYTWYYDTLKKACWKVKRLLKQYNITSYDEHMDNIYNPFKKTSIQRLYIVETTNPPLKITVRCYGKNHLYEELVKAFMNEDD